MDVLGLGARAQSMLNDKVSATKKQVSGGVKTVEKAVAKKVEQHAPGVAGAAVKTLRKVRDDAARDGVKALASGVKTTTPVVAAAKAAVKKPAKDDTHDVSVRTVPDGDGTRTITTHRAVEGPVTSSEVNETKRDANGTPISTKITRTQEVDGLFNLFGGSDAKKQTDVIEYDANGVIDKVTRDYPEDQQNAFNDRAAWHAGLRGDDAYFTFGRVDRMPVVEDGKLVKNGIVSGPGATVNVGGTRVFVEGLDPDDTTGSRSGATRAERDAAQRLKDVRELIGQTPTQLMEGSKGIRVVNMEAEGGGVAWVGGSHNEDRMVITNGSRYLDAPNLFWHENTHVSDPRGRDAEWQEAARSDQSVAQDVIDSIPADAQVTAVRDDLLRDKDGHLGVTGYGSGETEVNRTEDFAESVMLYLLSQRDGGIVTVANADGSERKITFEQMYPERTKLIKDIYGDFRGWTPPAAQEHTAEIDLG